MARIYTADELIQLVRDEARIPDTAATGNSDADILNRINETLTSYLYGMVMEVKEEYFLRTIRVSLSDTEERYKIPARAMYQKLRDIKWAETETGGFSSLAHMNIGDLDQEYASQATSPTPAAFYVEGNHVHLWPNLEGAKGTLDMSFYFAPGDLVLQANVAKVTNVSGSDITIDAVPSGWGTALANYDVHSPDSGAEIRLWGREASRASTILTFSADGGGPPDGSIVGEDPVEVGDYVCLENEAALPGLPRELHPTVAKCAAASILEDEGDSEGFSAKTALADRELFGYKRSLGALGRMENRVEAKPRYIRGGMFLDSHGRW